jgi:hypothetical protein
MMTDGKEQKEDVRDDATDSRTLDEIEAEEEVPASESDSSVPSPDEGGEREDDSDVDGIA